MDKVNLIEIVANADPVVGAIMAALTLASLIVWSIACEKLVRLARFNRQILGLERSLKTSVAGDESPKCPLAHRLRAAAAAEPRSEAETPAEFSARLERSLMAEARAEIRDLQAGVAFLATTGSTAPFIGLFGTVWGVMRSFIGIGAAQDANLAAVAPGIAEALCATAVGLAAAIPAVIFYNQINVTLGRAAERLGDAVRRLGRRHVYGPATAATEIAP